MTFYVESETDKTLPFDMEEVAGKVIAEALLWRTGLMRRR